MNKEVEAVTAILERYMSRVNARGLVARALQERGLSEHASSLVKLVQCTRALRGGIELFLSPRVRSEARDRFKEFFRGRARSEGSGVDLQKESDITVGRSGARRLCESA